MRIIRDNQYVSTHQRRFKLSAVAGFLALLGTFPVAFVMQGNSGLVFLTYLLLLGGFVLFNRGMRGVGRWSHNARHSREDLALDNHLGELSDRYTLVHFASTGHGLVEHVLIGPGGVVVITTSDFPGPATVTNDMWRKGGPMLGKMFSFSGPQLGNPSKKAEQEFSVVEKTLESAGQDVDIYNVIVFTTGSPELEVNGSSHPVMPVDELPHFIRDIEPDDGFSVANRDAVVALFAGKGQVETTVKTSTRRPVKVKKRAA